jgi:endonuclease/exonuclease/phosphatase family metal-dependent hydrolase
MSNRSRRAVRTLGATLFVLAAGCSRAGPPSTPSMPPPGDGEFRLATWNIRFFPEPNTDVERTAGALADLDADLIAVQEIADADALAGMLELVNARLAARRTDPGREPRRYEFELAASGGHGGQFVGYVYDGNAVALSDVETLTRLQMTPDLRPGLFARVKSLRGGLDFQIIVMHTDSGTKDRDYENRVRFRDSLAVELPGRRAVDDDIVVLGDLNTMGRLAEGDLPRVRAEEEIADLDEDALEMGLRRLAVSPSCTEYYRGRGSVLDHILVSRSMDEVPPDAVARVGGYCAATDCRPVDPDDMPYDYQHVSDHCPVVIDLVDADRD